MSRKFYLTVASITGLAGFMFTIYTKHLTARTLPVCLKYKAFIKKYKILF